MRRILRRITVPAVLAAAVTACDTVSDVTPLSIGESGETIVLTYLDRNGDFNFVEPVDTPLAGMQVRLVQRGTEREVARGLSDQRGVVLLTSVPVGSYELRVDSTVLGDSLGIATLGAGVVTIGAVDTAVIQVVADIPSISLRAARGSRTGKLVSVVATTLTQPESFNDSTAHLADSTGFLLATSVRPGSVPAGSEVRLIGRMGMRGGQPVLQTVMAFVGGEGTVPDPVEVTTGEAARADGGGLDAAPVRISDATVVEAGRNAAGDVRLLVDDGSGVAEIFLDRRIPFSPGAPLVPGVIVDATGFLVPTGTGTWRLRPRADDDLEVRVATVTIAEARGMDAGRLVAVEGVAVTGWQTFADSTLHVADPTGSLRGLRIPPTFAFPADRVRLVGIIAIRDQQKVLNDVLLTLLGGQGTIPSAVAITTATAATAHDGALDAALVRVTNAVVTDTVTVGADFRVTVEDVSGEPVDVVIDGNSGVSRSAFLPAARFDLTGVLVPAPGGATFRLKPRSSGDVSPR